MKDKKSLSDKIVALVARLGHMESIITAVGIGIVAVLAIATAAVLIARSGKDDDIGVISAGEVKMEDIVICLDPGHGYDDPGADSDYLGELSEADINLSVSLKIRDILSSRGYKVVMTHDGTGTVEPSEDGIRRLELSERTEFADNSLATHYISIHCDSYTADESVCGTRIYYLSSGENGKNSFKLARRLNSAIEKLPEAKVSLMPMSESEAYYVLKNVSCPSVLVELGFITNEAEAAKLVSPEWQDTVALGIADGISKYLS